MPLGVFRCEQIESEVRLPRNPIGRPETDENRVWRKQVFLNNLDAGKMNLGPKNIETTNVGQENCSRV